MRTAPVTQEHEKLPTRLTNCVRLDLLTGPAVFEKEDQANKTTEREKRKGKLRTTRKREKENSGW